MEQTPVLQLKPNLNKPPRLTVLVVVDMYNNNNPNSNSSNNNSNLNKQFKKQNIVAKLTMDGLNMMKKPVKFSKKITKKMSKPSSTS